MPNAQILANMLSKCYVEYPKLKNDYDMAISVTSYDYDVAISVTSCMRERNK